VRRIPTNNALVCAKGTVQFAVARPVPAAEETAGTSAVSPRKGAAWPVSAAELGRGQRNALLALSKTRIEQKNRTFIPGQQGKRGACPLASPQKLCQEGCPLANPSESVTCKPLEVQVGDKGIERAIKHLKRKMAAEGILRELKRRRHYMKPSVKRRKKMSEAARRRRKRLRADQEQRTGNAL